MPGLSTALRRRGDELAGPIMKIVCIRCWYALGAFHSHMLDRVLNLASFWRRAMPGGEIQYQAADWLRPGRVWNALVAVRLSFMRHPGSVLTGWFRKRIIGSLRDRCRLVFTTLAESRSRNSAQSRNPTHGMSLTAGILLTKSR